MKQNKYRPRRSCLYMPASNTRALEKAKSLAADTIIFDLEDAVAPDAKGSAREQAFEALDNGGYGNREIVVRINAMDTPWFSDDIKMVCASKANAILVPKITRGNDIIELSEAMDRHGASSDMALWAMIEMPLAILHIAEIAAAASTSRLHAFAMGFNDLAKEMRAEPDSSRVIFNVAMAQTVMAARAYGVTILDSVYNDFKDPEGLEKECAQAKQFGFDGKTLIHPAQIQIANAQFSPSLEKIAEAQEVIAAFDDPANAGKGVITVNGKMTELLHLQQAKETMAVVEGNTQIIE